MKLLSFEHNHTGAHRTCVSEIEGILSLNPCVYFKSSLFLVMLSFVSRMKEILNLSCPFDNQKINLKKFWL